MTTPSPAMRYPPLLIRDLLLGNPALTVLVGARMSTRTGDASMPFLLVRSAGNTPIGISGYRMHAPLIQVEGCCPGGWPGGDPQVVASDIAWAAVDALASRRNVRAAGAVFNVRHIDGPVEDIDVTRGADTPIYRAIARFELTLRNTVSA